jgi:uncharacterized protein YbjT (DUF2867 family)
MAKALVIGATGLIGKEVVKLLLKDPSYDQVNVIARKPLDIEDKKLHFFQNDFETLDAISGAFAVDQVFCCLGTTMKKSGGKEAFMRVDYHYPIEVARRAKEHGARHYLLVTSMGANSKSKVFYSRVKGKVEEEIKKIGFEGLSILRPSLLLGDRNERRLGEDIGKVVMKLIPYFGKMKNYRPILGKQVAVSMVKAATSPLPCFQILESGSMQD